MSTPNYDTDILQKLLTAPYPEQAAAFAALYPQSPLLPHLSRNHAFNRQKVRQGLQKALQQASGHTATEIVTGKAIYPPELRDWETRYKAAIKEASSLKSQALVADDEAENYARAARIVSLFEEVIRPFWEARDHFRRTGSLPPKPPEIPNLSGRPLAWLMRREQTLNRYLRDLKQGKRNSDRQTEWQAELAEVVKLIAEADTD